MNNIISKSADGLKYTKSCAKGAKEQSSCRGRFRLGVLWLILALLVIICILKYLRISRLFKIYDHCQKFKHSRFFPPLTLSRD